MKILLCDLETAPNLAYVWGLFRQNIPIKAIAESSYVMCWAAKWYGEKRIHFNSIQQSSREDMLSEIHALLDEADIVIHYNGRRFDIPTLNKEFLIEGIGPPAPYRQVDLLRVARGEFRFTSNKLDYVCQALGIGAKTKNIDYNLWLDCMKGDTKAWRLMKQYNRNDVVILESLYNKLIPWIRNHPNHNLYNGYDVNSCPKCGSSSFTSRGVAKTKSVTYRRYQCSKCNGWFKGPKHEDHIPIRYSEIPNG